MTSEQTIRLIRMFLDDTRDFFPHTSEVLRAINEAQHRKIYEYYMRHDERALRPLYRQTARVAPGATISDQYNMQVMFPRACIIYQDYVVPSSLGYFADFLPEETYFNYDKSQWLPGSTSVTRACYYTVTRGYDPALLDNWSYLYFTGPDTASAVLYYIAFPRPFTFDNGTLVGVPLQVSSEYHTEIAMLAAELLNDMDVGEQFRGDAVYQNQRLTLEDK